MIDTSNRATVSLEGDIIRAQIVGGITDEVTKQLLHDIEHLRSGLHARGQKILVLIDLTQAGKTDTNARQLLRSFFKKVDYDRIAFFGGSKENSQVLQYLLSSIARALRIKNFKTEAQALSWLRHKPTAPFVKAQRLLLIAAGIVLIILGWQLWAGPQLLRLPNDFSYKATIVSYDNFYNAQTAGYDGKTLSDTRFIYQATSTHNGIVDIKNSFDVRTTSGEKIFAVERLYSIDQQTRQHVPGKGDRSRSGYLFAPSNSTKQDFTYWHVNYDEPVLMKFQDEEDVLGITTYRYAAEYHADQTEDLSHLPGVGTSRGINLDINLQLWIEPTTGHLIKYEDTATAYYYDLATGKRINPWNQFSNNYSFDSIAAHVQLAEQERLQKEIIEIGIPSALGIIAAALFIWAGILARRGWSEKADRPLTWPRIGATIVGLTAITVIVGWLIDMPLFTRLHSSFSAMHPITANNLLLLSIVVLLLTTLKQGRRGRPAIWVLLGFSTLSQFAFLAHSLLGVQLPADKLLRALHLPPIASISPITVICFLLIIIAISLSLWFKNRVATIISQLNLIAVFGLASFTIGGYAFSLQDLYSITWFRAMALHTGILFLVLVVCIFLLHTEWNITRRIRSASRSILVAFAVLLILLTATGLAWQQTINSAANKAEFRFQADASDLKTKITDELTGYVRALQGARGLFSASEAVSRDEWKEYVDSLRLAQNYPGMIGLGFVQTFPSAQKNTHIAEVRSQGFPSYTITPPGQRDIYNPVVYIEPFNAQNQRAFGYDMFSEVTRRQAMEEARDIGEATLSGKVTLVQELEAGRQFGMLMYLPIYHHDASLASPTERQKALVGYVYAPIRMTNFMRAAISNQTQGLNIELFDASSSEKLTLDNRLYVISSQYGIENKRYTPKFVRLETVSSANRDVTFRFSSLPAYTSSATEALPSFILFGGIALSVLLALLAFLLSSSRSRALSLAHTMTIDLRNERNIAIITRRKNEAILKSIGDGVFVVDSTGSIILFNKVAEALSGFTAGEAMGQHYTKILGFYKEQNLNRVDAFIRSALEGKRAEMGQYTLLKRKDGSTIPVADSAAPVLNAEGGIEGAVVVFRDITRERQLEHMKDEFLSVASHELRTPMGAVRANIAMILDGDYGPVNKGLVEPLTDMKASTIRLVELVNDLLNVARIEAGRMKFTLSDFDLHEVLRSTVASLAPLGKEKGIQIRLESNQAVQVQADPDKVKQIVTNLIGNSLKFTEQGEIVVTVDSAQADLVEIAVRDTGIGISAEDQKELFGKFKQISSAQAGKPAGTGLGLYISREIVHKMGGELWIKASAPGKGSAFAFTLPSSQSLTAQKVKRLIEQEAKLHPDQK